MDLPIKIKVVLEDMPHEVSRMILVPQNINLMQLHYTIQLCMGWTFSHLFQFCDKKWKSTIQASYGVSDDIDIFGTEETPADLVMLKDDFYEKRAKKPFFYWYDFGDDWWHKISFLKVRPADLNIYRGAPKCVEAIGACPPEDVGGPHGYSQFLEIINNPMHPDHLDFLAWRGIPKGFEYNTNHVDINLINAYLTGYFFSPDWKLRAEVFLKKSPTPFLQNLFDL